MNTLRLTTSGKLDSLGLLEMALEFIARGNVVKAVPVCSGAPGFQFLRAYSDPASKPGSLEPIPEGRYGIGPLEFVGGAFDWVGTWGDGLGDLWCSIIVPEAMSRAGGRNSFGFHLDENRAWSPGSAGCVTFATKREAEVWVQHMRKHDPQELVVDWGLGTINKLASPPSPTPPATPEGGDYLKLFGNRGRLTAIVNGEPIQCESFELIAKIRK